MKLEVKNCSIIILIEVSYLCAQLLHSQLKEKSLVEPHQFQRQILQPQIFIPQEVLI